MNITAAIGWALLFLVIGFCAFAWDRQPSTRQRREQALTTGKPQRRWASTLMKMAIGLGILGGLALLFASGPSGESGPMFYATILMLALFVFLGGLLIMKLAWTVADVFRQGNLRGQLNKMVRFLRFQLWHVLSLVGIVGLSAGIVRISFPQRPVGNWILLTIVFSVIGLGIWAIGYLGVDTLFFGRGSGRRANRVHELCERRMRAKTQQARKGRQRNS